MEIRSLFGPDADLAESAATLTKWGARWVVVKNGAAGVLLADGRSQTVTSIAPYHLSNDPRVSDVTGAGDSFCGGFMVGLAKTGDALQAIRYGLVAASLVIEGYGALYALSRRAGVQTRLAELQYQ